jgi:3-phosphoshikimate 1-carboxyvinyltransferase
LNRAELLTICGPARPLSGEAQVSGDKSIGHRAVLLSAISEGRATIAGLSDGEDNRRTVAALAALGVPMERPRPGELIVYGVGLFGLRPPSSEIDCGNSGTTIRLLCGLLGAQPFPTRLTGDDSLCARPMRRVATPLGQMGVVIEGRPGRREAEIYPPLAVSGPKEGAVLRGAEIRSSVASAQVKSAVLLCGLYAEGPTRFTEPVRSRDHTERMLRHLGVPIAVEQTRVTLDPRGWSQRLPPTNWRVPGDLSSAAFLLGAATLVSGSRVTVRSVGVNPTRTGFLDALLAMGATVERANERDESGEPVADLVASFSQLRGCEIRGELAVRALDELPLLAALAAHARGTTVIADAEELRVKESDRIATTAAMLRALGVEVEERPDGLVIEGRAGSDVRPDVPRVIQSHGDHRIAMAGAVCALAAAGQTTIRDTANIATSFPNFVETLRALGADLHCSR